MNLTIGSTFPNTWKRIKTQHLVALCGATLAISAGVGVGAWQVSDSGGSARAPAVSLPRSVPASTQVFYIVDSPEQALTMSGGLNEVATGVTEFDYRYDFIDTSTPEGQTAFEALQRSLMGAGVAAASGVQLVDLRGK